MLKPEEAECPELQPSQHHRHAIGLRGGHLGARCGRGTPGLEREAEEQQPENEDLLASGIGTESSSSKSNE